MVPTFVDVVNSSEKVGNLPKPKYLGLKLKNEDLIPLILHMA